MADEGRSGSDVVEVSVVVAARRTTVWRCVTERDLLSRWLQAEVSLEPRIGARVTIDFARYGTVVEGVVEEVMVAERLVFTWGASSGPGAAEMPAGSTRVTISLADDAGGGTRVTLRHAALCRHSHFRLRSHDRPLTADQSPAAFIRRRMRMQRTH